MSTVRDIMSTRLVTIAPASTIAEAATVMGANHIGSVLVFQDEALVGIFTERDILRALASDFDAAGHRVSHWMTADPAKVEADASAKDALALMLERGFRHLPVTDAGDVVGVVSMRDLTAGVD